MHSMDKQTKLIVVTGASGRVANHLVKLLLLKGKKVHAIARDISKLQSLKQAGAALIEASFTDTDILTREFLNAEAVFVFTPLNLHATNLNEEQYKIVKSLIQVIRNSEVKNVVLLSSWGVELTEKNGGILGCRFFEQELDKIKELNTLILRPVWFMENFNYNIELIKMSGINGLAIKPQVRFPMVNTKSIAEVAAEYLNNFSIIGKHILYLKSKQEYNMQEVTQIIGSAVGMPELKYIELPQAVQKKEW
jgi:uncharacterized protein YbjT (DUF2867 family)